MVWIMTGWAEIVETSSNYKHKLKRDIKMSLFNNTILNLLKSFFYFIVKTFIPFDRFRFKVFTLLHFI